MKHLILPLIILSIGCGARQSTIAGTTIPRTDTNQEIIARVEEYRLALEQKDAAALMLMSSKDYWEDSGTTSGEDDYGYEGLQDVLATRFQQVDSIRYALRYIKVRRRGCESDEVPCRAFVDLIVDASFTAMDARGERKRFDKRDQNQLVLELKDNKWLFLRGM